MSSGAKVKLRYVPEVTYNTTPVNSTNWKPIRYVSDDLDGKPVVEHSNEVTSDRMRRHESVVAEEIGGGFAFELTAGDPFDDFLQAALCGTWDTHVLKVGSTERSFTIEKEYSDIASGSRFIRYTGMRVSDLELTVKAGAIVSGMVKFAGAGVNAATTSAVGTGSEADVDTTVPITAAADLSGLEVDDAAFTGCINEIKINISNSLRPSNCVGSTGPGNHNYGLAVVTGTVSAYLAVATVDWFTDHVIDRDPMKLEWTLAANGDSYAIVIPVLKLIAPPPQNPGLESDVMINGEFQAYYDATAETSLQITRVQAA